MKKIICCKDESDFHIVQLALFSQGIFWEESGNTLMNMDKYIPDECALRVGKKVIKAVGETQRYKTNDYAHIDITKYRIITSDMYLRKVKLKRLNSYGNV